MKHSFRNVIIYIVFIAVIIITTAALWSRVPSESVHYSDIVTLFENERVKRFEVDGDNNVKLVVRDKASDGTETEKNVNYKVRDLAIFYEDLNPLISEQLEAGIIEYYDYPGPNEVPFWVPYIPYVIIIVLIIAMWVFFMRSEIGGRGSRLNSVGRAKAKLASVDKTNVFFKDVAGADEEKAELEEIVEFLRNPSFFTKLGARIPHGVLLVGPPGTGKTLIAKAVAGEAGVPFFSISGSDFVEMYVGVGASRVRDLFETAKKHPAAIIFIDEIDAVGRHRGAGLGGGHDEREQTLNQLLVEMDGFDTNAGVIVMAATNRPDILDPALLRPGRFDRTVTMNYPDINGRLEILKVHSRNKPLEDGVDLEVIARTTVGFTGADLSNLLNEAALLAARKGKHLIGMNDIEESMIKVIVGTSKKSRIFTDEEKKNTAYHEAGHAIVTYFRAKDDPVHQISIIPSGRALGYTLNLPKRDRNQITKTELEGSIAVCLGGRIAEKIIFGDITTGASEDIQRATSKARMMVMKYGMSDELGPILYGNESTSDEVFLGRDFNNTKTYSEQTAALIDAEIKKIISAAYADAEQILRDNIEKLHFIADYLIKNEVMEEEQFRLVMEGEPTVEELEAMVAEKRKRSEEENKQRAAHIKEEERRREEERRLEELKKNGGAFAHQNGSPRPDEPVQDTPIHDKPESNDPVTQDQNAETTNSPESEQPKEPVGQDNENDED